MLTKSERILNIPEKEAARKDKNSHVNRYGIKEGKVAMTVVRIKC